MVLALGFWQRLEVMMYAKWVMAIQKHAKNQLHMVAKLLLYSSETTAFEP